MKIIADENMPNAQRLFSGLGDVTLVSGRDLTKDMLADAEVLLVRSVTKVNEALLAGSSIKYVGSATIGTDHIDKSYLAKQGIGFNSAPGCNADAVADYVFSSLAHLYLNKGLNWLDATIGVIGQGNVGKTVAARFVKLGCNVTVYDPLVQSSVASVTQGTLEEVLGADVVCLHAPLTRTGDYPSFDMVNAQRVANLRAGQTIISAGRGGVINEEALMARFDELNGALNLVFDVWHQEPTPNMAFARICDIATPHIAGYSKQGREKGTWQIYEAMCKYFDLNVRSSFSESISRGSIESLSLSKQLSPLEFLSRAMLAIYDPSRDSNRFLRIMTSGQLKPFDWLRKHYVERDEFSTCVISAPSYEQQLMALGFKKAFEK